MNIIANYSDAKRTHLTRLHIDPGEKCNDVKYTRKIQTRRQMLDAILSVTKLDQICAHEFEE